MKIKLIKFEKLISNKRIFEKSLKKTKEYYRPFDPGNYLYNLLLKKTDKIDLFCDEYLELVYTTLIAWNMNGRGAKLSDINTFKNSIRKNKSDIIKLKKYRIEKLCENNEEIFEILDSLFEKLDLVEKSWTGKKIKSKLVTFSKTLHFLLPKLIVPIDRRYTLNFFYNNKIVPTDNDIKKNNKKQMKIFKELHLKFYEIGKIYELEKSKDNKWNLNLPKIIDNAIIGYSKL
jgi:hypothetical protein